MKAVVGSNEIFETNIILDLLMIKTTSLIITKLRTPRVNLVTVLRFLFFDRVQFKILELKPVTRNP